MDSRFCIWLGGNTTVGRNELGLSRKTEQMPITVESYELAMELYIIIKVAGRNIGLMQIEVNN